MRIFCARLTVFFLACLYFFACSAETNSWRGTIRNENGVVVVDNPRTPLFDSVGVVLEEDLSIGGDEKNHSLFFSISDIDVDEKGRIYVLDGGEKNIKIFDPDGNWVQTFGGPGQGPGELSQPVSIACGKEKIIVLDGIFAASARMYDLLGEYLHTVDLGKSWMYGFNSDSRDHYLMISMEMGKDQDTYTCIGFYDDRMELVWEVDKIPFDIQRKSVEMFSPTPWVNFDSSGHIVYAYPDDYEIRFYKSEGTVLKKIRRDYQPVAISDEAKEEKLKSINRISQLKLEFPRYYPAFQRFLTDDVGRLFVQTWELADDQYLYDVFNPEGRYTFQIPLPNGLNCIRQGKLYCIDEDEEGFPFIKRYAISGLND